MNLKTSFKIMQQSNSDIFIDLKGENTCAFGELYKKHFSMVNRFVINNNGTTIDAQDIFQETMLIFVEKLRQDDFHLTASVKTYIMAIVKHLCLKKMRAPHRETAFTDSHNNQFYDEITYVVEQEQSYWDKLENYMSKITSHCNRLIHDMFFKNKPIDQIQQEYGYSTKHNAINQKHKCVEQIRKVKEQEEKKEI